MAKTQKISVAHVSSRPPIVAVLGHVDHGKTTLLDTIRKTNVAAGEHGGITQAIGAYQIKLKAQSSKLKTEEEREITFIDTPGHEAFAKMRSRGAAVADIAILVVAADDSVKPQTIESIEQIKQAGIPMIVAVNKVDLPAANIDRVKQDLAKHGVQVEGFGGDVPFVLVSGKQGTGINELLDLILLVSDMKGIPSNPQFPVEAVVIETRMDKGIGMVATLIVKFGTVKTGTLLYDGANQVAKVRAMKDEQGSSVLLAGPGKPIEVLGFTNFPSVGMTLTDVSKPRNIDQTLLERTQPVALGELPDFLNPIDPEADRKISIILKADTAGSLEAVMASLPKKVDVVQSGVGDIEGADVLFAKSSHAVVIGLGVACKTTVAKLAQTEKVMYRTYTIIYELLGELAEVVAGLKVVIGKERELGRGTIIAEFPFNGFRIAGTKVSSGRLARGDSVKIVRQEKEGETEIGRVKIKSVRRGREDITKAEVGLECGILFDQKLDFTIGDAIIAVTIG
ncbi:MAG: translation initiation factor IF-2 [Patescibacteria group bacterium]